MRGVCVAVPVLFTRDSRGAVSVCAERWCYVRLTGVKGWLEWVFCCFISFLNSTINPLVKPLLSEQLSQSPVCTVR